MKNLNRIFVLLLACSLLLAGGMARAEGKSVTIGLNVPVQSLNPIRMTSAGEQMLAANILETLVRADENGVLSVGRGLAESMTCNDEKTEFTLKLRNDARWSNGDPVTADDFVFAAERFIDPANAAPMAQFLLSVKNAMAVYTGQVDKSELGIEAVDDYTLKVSFSAPVNNIEETLYTIVFMPQNRAYVEKMGEDYATGPDTVLTCGPYILSEFNGSERIAYVKNPDYFAADTVNLDSLVYQVVTNAATRVSLFAAGELDFARSDVAVSAQYVGAPEEIKVPTSNSYYLCISNPSIENANIRKAIALSINRDALVMIANPIAEPSVSVASSAQQGPGDLSYGEWIKEQDVSLVSYDPEAAKAAFELGLSEMGVTAESLNGKYTCLSSEGFEMVASFIAGQVKETLGLEIAVETTTYPDAQSRMLGGDYDMSPASLTFTTDPLQPLSIFSNQSLFDFAHYDNDEYDALYLKAMLNPTESRFDDMLQLEKILCRDAVVVPLMNGNYQLLASSRLKNVIVGVNMILPDTRYLDVA